MTNQGTIFTRKDLKEFAHQKEFKITHYTQYAQINGQVEITNKTSILTLKKLVRNNFKT